MRSLLLVRLLGDTAGCCDCTLLGRLPGVTEARVDGGSTFNYRRSTTHTVHTRGWECCGVAPRRRQTGLSTPEPSGRSLLLKYSSQHTDTQVHASETETTSPVETGRWSGRPGVRGAGHDSYCLLPSAARAEVCRVAGMRAERGTTEVDGGFSSNACFFRSNPTVRVGRPI